MTLSLLLNNGQLTLPKGGKLPQSTSCCCDLSPPPVCYDLYDYCSLFLELVSPQSLALKTLPARCNEGPGDDAYATSTVGYFLNAPLGTYHWPDAIPASVTPTYDYSSVSLTTDEYPPALPPPKTVFGLVSTYFIGDYDAQCSHGYDLRISSHLFIDVSLVFERDRAPAPWFLRLYGYIDAGTAAVIVHDGELNDRHSWRWEFSGEYDIPAGDCVKRPQRNCNKYAGLTRLIETPLTFTVNKDGCDLGAFTSTNLTEAYNGETAAFVRSTGEAIRDAFSYTFKITSRPSCHAVPADCDVPIGNGDMTVVIATDPSQPAGTYGNDNFILGTEAEHQFSGPNDTTVRIEHFGAAAGDSGDPYFFLYQVKNQAGDILQEQYIELFCATDNAVSPPVSRWYVRIGTVCVTDLGTGQTYDEWIGAIASYESPGDYVGISLGDPVPLGEPDLVHNDDYPVSTGTLCEPPAPARFELSFGGG